MYKSYSLERFEKRVDCQLSDAQFEDIKQEVQFHINTLNEGIGKVEDFFNSYMQSYDRELTGMRSICSLVGISIRIKKEKH